MQNAAMPSTDMTDQIDHFSPVPLYRSALRGDTQRFARAAFDWLRAQVRFDAGMLVTTFADRPGFLDAHFDGFDDVPALMASWRDVAHLDILAPAMLAEPGVARRHDMADPRLAGPRFKPLREHLERFACRRSLCIAQQVPDSPLLTVIILVRRAPDDAGTPAELARLEAIAPAVAESYAGCRSMALARRGPGGMTELCIASVDRHGAYVQTTPAFAQALWAGAPPQDVHLDKEAFRVLKAGKPWAVPGSSLMLHAQPDDDGWLLRLRRRQPADDLTERERQIARRFALGESCPAIARALSLSPATVRNHMSKVYAKLQVSHRAGLIAALD